MTTPVSQLYPELMHYTTLRGLQGILSSGCIWATDAAYLNDSSEITHFFDVRLKALISQDAREYAIELARTPDYLARMIEDGGIDKIVEMETEARHAAMRNATLAMNRPFIVSLCGPANERVRSSGLLSQWRAYGGDGGYALVLDTLELEMALNAEAQAHHYLKILFGDVYYHGINPENQPATPDVAEYEAIVHQGIAHMLRGGTAEEVDRFYEAVTALSCLYKHWGFWEEREVRIVAVPANDEVAQAAGVDAPPRKEVRSFSRGEKLVPYVELFSELGPTGKQIKLPIKRIIVGPHKNRERHAESVRKILESNGYTVEVVQSEIPYVGN